MSERGKQAQARISCRSASTVRQLLIVLVVASRASK
jgi:hypothetical protein